MLKIVHDATADAVDDSETITVDLDELFRMAAQEMLAIALLAERRAYLDAHAELTDATAKRMVVGNGYARSRAVMTGAGMVDVKAPRVEDRRLDERFSSALLPAYMRRSPKVTEVLPLLYLRGLSTGDFGPALEGFFGSKGGPVGLHHLPAHRVVAGRARGLEERGTSPTSTTCTGGPTGCTSPTSAWP